MTRAPVIDMWAPVVPVPEVMRHVAEHFPKEMSGYMRVFRKQDPSKESFRASAEALTLSDDDVKGEGALRH